MTYFGVFNFGTSYLGAKIGQNKTMTKISRFTVTNECTNIHLAFSYRQLTNNINCDLFEPRLWRHWNRNNCNRPILWFLNWLVTLRATSTILRNIIKNARPIQFLRNTGFSSFNPWMTRSRPYLPLRQVRYLQRCLVYPFMLICPSNIKLFQSYNSQPFLMLLYVGVHTVSNRIRPSLS